MLELTHHATSSTKRHVRLRHTVKLFVDVDATNARLRYKLRLGPQT